MQQESHLYPDGSWTVDGIPLGMYEPLSSVSNSLQSFVWKSPAFSAGGLAL